MKFFRQEVAIGVPAGPVMELPWDDGLGVGEQRTSRAPVSDLYIYLYAGCGIHSPLGSLRLELTCPIDITR